MADRSASRSKRFGNTFGNATESWIRVLYGSSNFTSRYMPNRNVYLCLSNHNIPQRETIKRPLEIESLNTVVYLHNRGILSNENEQSTAIHNKMDEYPKIMSTERS